VIDGCEWLRQNDIIQRFRQRSQARRLGWYENGDTLLSPHFEKCENLGAWNNDFDDGTRLMSS